MTKLGCVLIAEDDENDRFFIEHAFREAAIQNPLQLANDGQAVMDYLAGVGDYADRNRYPVPCLLILDLKMPRKSGWDVLRWLRNESVLHRLPVIVFSSS